MNNTEIIEAFEMNLIGKKKSDNTVRNYVTSVEKQLKFIDNKSIHELTMIDLEKIRVQLQKKYSNARSYNLHIMALRVFVNFVVINELNNNINLDRFKDDFVSMKTVDDYDSGQDAIPTKKYMSLLKFFNSLKANSFLKARKKVVALIAVTTGLRREEIANIRKDEIDMDNGRMIIHDTKGNKPRIVTLTTYMIDAIINLYDWYEKKGITGDYLFLTDNSKKMHMTGVGRLINTVMNQAVTHGIITKEEKVTPHGCRKGYFTYLILECGLAPEKAMKLSGHSDINTLRRYVKVDNNELTDEVNEMIKLD